MDGDAKLYALALAAMKSPTNTVMLCASYVFAFSEDHARASGVELALKIYPLKDGFAGHAAHVSEVPNEFIVKFVSLTQAANSNAETESAHAEDEEWPTLIG